MSCYPGGSVLTSLARPEHRLVDVDEAVLVVLAEHCELAAERRRVVVGALQEAIEYKLVFPENRFSETIFKRI